MSKSQAGMLHDHGCLRMSRAIVTSHTVQRDTSKQQTINLSSLYESQTWSLIVSKFSFTVDNTMYLPKEHPDREERLNLANNISSQWESTTKNTTSIPLSIRYPKGLEWWPVRILRALSELADEMPGIDNWNNVYDLLVEGNKKRMKDENNDLSAEIQLSDISYVREQKENKGKQRMVDANNDVMFVSHKLFEVAKKLIDAEVNTTGLVTDGFAVAHPPDDTEDVGAAIEPDESSGATVIPTATNALPPVILPSDDQTTKWAK